MGVWSGRRFGQLFLFLFLGVRFEISIEVLSEKGHMESYRRGHGGHHVLNRIPSDIAMVSGLAVYEPIAWIGLDLGKTIPEKGDQGNKGGAQALKTSPLVVF